MIESIQYEPTGNGSVFSIPDIINTMNNDEYFLKRRPLKEAAEYVVKMAKETIVKLKLKVKMVDPIISVNPLFSDPLLSFHLWLLNEDGKAYKIWIHYFLYKINEYTPYEKLEFSQLVEEIQQFIVDEVLSYEV